MSRERPAAAKGGGREAALERALSQIERQFGRGSVMRLGAAQCAPVASLSTGALSLDLALGVGGVPRGRVTEIFGPEASGKTTLALEILASAQREGGHAVFIDAEHALDPFYARRLGVDLERLLVAQPECGEQALDIVETLVRADVVDAIVIDSVAALVPRAELAGEMGDQTVGLQARLMSQALRKLTGAIHRSRAAVVFVNQLREKVGVFFGNPETTPGGRALKFYASVRIEVRRQGTLKSGEEAVGLRAAAKVVKNKVAPPFRRAEFDIIFGQGISTEGDLLDLGLAAGILARSGAWLTWEGRQLGQGREAARQFLKEHPEAAEKLAARIRAGYR